MKEYQQKHMVRSLAYSKVTIVILFLLVILLLRSIMDLNGKRVDADKLRDDSIQERQKLQQKVDKAQKETDLIGTPRGFEAYVRTTYPVVKEGEGVIVVYDDNKNLVSSVREKMTFWERVSIWWKNYFK